MRIDELKAMLIVAYKLAQEARADPNGTAEAKLRMARTGGAALAVA